MQQAAFIRAKTKDIFDFLFIFVAKRIFVIKKNNCQ